MNVEWKIIIMLKDIWYHQEEVSPFSIFRDKSPYQNSSLSLIQLIGHQPDSSPHQKVTFSSLTGRWSAHLTERSSSPTFPNADILSRHIRLPEPTYPWRSLPTSRANLLGRCRPPKSHHYDTWEKYSRPPELSPNGLPIRYRYKNCQDLI